MLPLATVPPCLFEMLQACRGVFGAAGFATFVVLVVGAALGAVGPRTITGIWAATGLAHRLHWSRAHRFFSETRWDPDCLGLHLAHLVVGVRPQTARFTVGFEGEGHPGGPQQPAGTGPPRRTPGLRHHHHHRVRRRPALPLPLRPTTR